MIQKEDEQLGGIAAAILAAGIGAAACGIFYVLGASTPLRSCFELYKPSGALSGVSTAAVLTWLVAWIILARRWRSRTVDMWRISMVALGFLLLGLLLTFPPFARLL